MTNTISTPGKVTTMFSNLRVRYMERLRHQVIGECSANLDMLRTYTKRAGHTMVHSTKSTDLVSTEDMQYAFTVVLERSQAARSMVEVRDQRRELEYLKTRFGDAIETIFFSLTLVYGYRVN